MFIFSSITNKATRFIDEKSAVAYIKKFILIKVIPIIAIENGIIRFILVYLVISQLSKQRVWLPVVLVQNKQNSQKK